jgi:hypothetical protein
MACYEYKLTVEYVGALNWQCNIFRREVGVYQERGSWSCILSHEAPTLEGHLDPTARFRLLLRSLAA